MHCALSSTLYGRNMEYCCTVPTCCPVIATCCTSQRGVQAVAAPNSPTDRFAQLGCSLVCPFGSTCARLARDDVRTHMSAWNRPHDIFRLERIVCVPLHLAWSVIIVAGALRRLPRQGTPPSCPPRPQSCAATCPRSLLPGRSCSYTSLGHSNHLSKLTRGT